jgi:hypothetical protein
MDPIRNLALSCLALVVLIAFGGQAFANSTVGTCAGPGTHYLTIQAAVNGTNPGNAVEICPGTYPEQVVITKNLTLNGMGPTASVVVPPAGGLVPNGTDLAGFPARKVAAQILVQGVNATISHLTIDGAGNGLDGCGGVNILGIYYENSSGTITDSVVRNQIPLTDVGCQIGFGIYVASNTVIAPVVISDNSIRNYGKNGIIAAGVGNGFPPPTAYISKNTVVGLGPTTLVAANGIQLSLGATGNVVSNYVIDNVFINAPDCALKTCWGSSGILLYASQGVIVSSNTVETAQFGIVSMTDPYDGPADGTLIQSNHIGGTQNYDAIDLCSNSNIVHAHVIYGSSQDAIHTDDSCGGTGNNNFITANTINESCAGILLGTGWGNTVSPNMFMNVASTTLEGDVCPAAPSTADVTGAMGLSKSRGSNAMHPSLRPSH